MAKKALINNFFNLSRRSYAKLATDNLQNTLKGTMTRKGPSESGSLGTEALEASKEIFWMRDPKTGNWIPENRFGDTDVAELREKLLSKK